MPTFDVFNQNAFASVSLTAALEKVPHQPQLLGQLGIFEPVPIRTTSIAIEERSGTLSLVQTTPRGAPLAQRTTEKRVIRDFRTVRIAKGDTITAEELQNIRAFGSETELMQVQAEVMRRYAGPTGILRDLELTWENMRLGAVQGIVTDADGSTIRNWFTEFSVTQATEIDFALTTATTNVRAKCAQVVRAMQRAAKGAWVATTRIVGLCDDEFWDALINHALVRDTYLNWQAAADLRKDLTWQQFDFGGITFINYRGTDDNSTVAIAANKCKFFPVGAPGVFQVALSPAETFDFVNTPGRPVYGMIIPDKDRNAFVDVEAYSYPLFVCTRPLMLQRAKKA